MQRTIKFRAWDKTLNKIHSWSIIENHFTFEELLDDNFFEAMQYTGLKDKNGVEIYEGDIISCTQQRFSTNGIVTMHHGMWNWQYKKGAVSLLYEANKKWEGTVIGNIYENPELVK